SRVVDVTLRLREAGRVGQKGAQVCDPIVHAPALQQEKRQPVVRSRGVRLELQHPPVRPDRLVRHPDAGIGDRDLLEDVRVVRALSEREPEGGQRLVELLLPEEVHSFLIVVRILRGLARPATDDVPPPRHRRTATMDRDSCDHAEPSRPANPSSYRWGGSDATTTPSCSSSTLSPRSRSAPAIPAGAGSSTRCAPGARARSDSSRRRSAASPPSTTPRSEASRKGSGPARRSRLRVAGPEPAGSGPATAAATFAAGRSRATSAAVSAGRPARSTVPGLPPIPRRAAIR